MHAYKGMFSGTATEYGEVNAMLDVSHATFGADVVSISNLCLPGQEAFIAGPSIMILLQAERQIFSSARHVNVAAAEKIFNSAIAEAVKDAESATADIIGEGHPTKLELLSNFAELFNTCVDSAKLLAAQ